MNPRNLGHRPAPVARSRVIGTLAGLVLAALPVFAQPAPSVPSATAPGLRDPTRPPAASRPATPTPGGPDTAATEAPPDAVRHLMVLQGRPYLIERGWPRGVGDRVGDARIERFETQAVWLRHADGVLRRWPLYPGVEWRPAAAASAPRKETRP